jgi:hypothetical protein
MNMRRQANKSEFVVIVALCTCLKIFEFLVALDMVKMRIESAFLLLHYLYQDVKNSVLFT